MTTPTLTTPPAAPSRSNAPAVFIARANAFIAWFATFVSELLTAITWFDTTAAQVALDRLATAASETAAAASEEGAADAYDATMTEGTALVALAQGYATSALNAPGTNATSSTGRSLTTGSKDFTLNQTGKLFSIGQTVVVTRTSDPTKRMVGPITAFAADVLTVDVQLLSSTGGPYTDWTIALSAPPLSAVASQAEAEAGTVNDKEMTPLRTAQAILALARFAPDVIVQDQKASGSGGDSLTASTANVRSLNTVVRNQSSVGVLASNSLTLPAGTWQLRARATVFGTSSTNGMIKAVTDIYDSTNAAVLARSAAVQVVGDNLSSTFTAAEMEAVAVVTLSGATAIRIRTRPSQAAAGGVAMGTGSAEVYSTLEATKVA